MLTKHHNVRKQSIMDIDHSQRLPETRYFVNDTENVKLFIQNNANAYLVNLSSSVVDAAVAASSAPPLSQHLFPKNQNNSNTKKECFISSKD